tara:strand:- start:128 stop:913 length:786 start_codon:yes stop_codon:yes gene_type:complete
MKIIITGWNGFIGRNVMKKLIDDHECQLIDSDLIDRPSWKNQLDFYVQNTDVILHIGAISDTTLQDSNEMLKYNYIFSKNLFDLAKKYNKKVIYSSSAANTGTDGTPSNIYGWSKLLAEQYGLALNFDFVALRYFNVYGPGEERKGKMASVAYQSYQNGSFMLFPQKPKRDFVYVKDIVSATIYPLFNNIESGVYEVGSGEARLFEDVLDLMEIPYEYKQEYEIPNWYQYHTKSDKSKWMPGWEPEYDLESGIKDYKDFLK